MEKKFFIVDEINENKRLDLFLKNNLEDKSRSYIQNLIEEEKVKVNGKIKKSNYKLKDKDEVTIEIPDAIPLEVTPEDIPLDIIYEDNDVIVVNKPQDMVVHPAPGNYNGTLVNALLYHCKDLSGINGILRPGIVHRIDKDTSGILVIAKNDNSHNKLAAQLKDHSMNRTYYALVEGRVKEEEGTVDAPIGRHPVDRIKMAIVKDGREAITHYKVIERFNHYTLVKCNLETGRTHQIRVHMASLGHPLVGDEVYGFKKQKFKLKGQVLHAKTLGFIHPSTNEYIEFNSKLPQYFEELLNILRKSDL